ncbi:hypothetical protein BaRGS_00016917 [Batillaria attramentaria]|uniref:Uncharacterized protein n=1 Tax=Batillaria attramentaria TaxID=370345 RepID=A0ABD0KY71_9CAEN
MQKQNVRLVIGRLHSGSRKRAARVSRCGRRCDRAVRMNTCWAQTCQHDPVLYVLQSILNDGYVSAVRQLQTTRAARGEGQTERDWCREVSQSRSQHRRFDLDCRFLEELPGKFHALEAITGVPWFLVSKSDAENFSRNILLAFVTLRARAVNPAIPTVLALMGGLFIVAFGLSILRLV